MPRSPEAGPDPAPRADRPVVLLSVRRSRRRSNPYIALFERAVAPQVDTLRFTWRQALTGHYDVLHVFWPEDLVRGRGPFQVGVHMLLLCVLIARLKVTRRLVVRTVYDLVPHHRLPRPARLLLKTFNRLANVRVYQSEAAREEAGDRKGVIIKHGDYREWFRDLERAAGQAPDAGTPDGAAASPSASASGKAADAGTPETLAGAAGATGPVQGADAGTAADGDVAGGASRGAVAVPPRPGRLLEFGRLRPDKGVEELLQAFGETRSGARLLVAGKPRPKDFGKRLVQAAAGLERCTVVPRFVPDGDLWRLIRGADLIVFPFHHVTSSGSLMLALSAGTPVLIPDGPLTREFEAECGADWVVVYAGALRGDVIDNALAITRHTAHRTALPEFAGRDWDAIGQAYTHLYRHESLPASSRAEGYQVARSAFDAWHASSTGAGGADA